MIMINMQWRSTVSRIGGGEDLTAELRDSLLVFQRQRRLTPSTFVRISVTDD